MPTAFFMVTMNIVLVGYRCSGKTTVGKSIAGKTERIFLDTDGMIEDKADCSIEEIISRDGWSRFRNMERGLIRELSSKDNLVIATGGGVVMDEDNMRNLKRSGFIVWLKGSPSVLRDRMEKDRLSGFQRPSLTGQDPLREIERVLEQRKPYYQRAGDLSIDTDLLEAGEVADLIIREFNERA